MKPTKTLIFEGAGWDKADSCSDVGNCRIRATFTNDKGQQLYLEMNGMTVHKYVIPKMKSYNIVGWIQHCFNTQNHRANYTKGLSEYQDGFYFEWTRANILKFVNIHLGCSFDSIEVRNEDWCGFSPDGDPKNDFHLKNRIKEQDQ